MELYEGASVPLTLEDVGGQTKAATDRILASFKNTDMGIGVTCIHEVHGHLDGAGSECASLLVLRFELGNRATGRRFKTFKPLLTFHSHPRCEGEEDELYVTDAIEPGLYNVHICEFTSSMEKGKTVKAALNVNPPELIPVEGGLEWARDTRETWTEVYRYTVQASRFQEVPGPDRGYDQLSWKAEQGKLIKSGIDIMQVAFLIVRAEGYDLEIKFNLDADVDFKYRYKRGFKNLLGLPGSEQIAKMTIYKTNPDTGAKSLRETKVPVGVERDYLGKLQKESKDVFRRLAWVHDVEPLRPIFIHGNEGTTSSQADDAQVDTSAAVSQESKTDGQGVHSNGGKNPSGDTDKEAHHDDDELSDVGVEYESADSWATAESQL